MSFISTIRMMRIGADALGPFEEQGSYSLGALAGCFSAGRRI